MPQPNNFSRVPHVEARSPLTAGNTGQATRALEQRTNYLFDLLTAIEAGKVLAQQDQTVSIDVEVGDCVYWDAVNLQYDRALAGVDTNNATSTLVPTPSSDCLGICASKIGPTTGTIVMLGSIRVTSDVLTAMIDGTPEPGRYYLSPVNPGKLVKQRPPVTVAVAYVLGNINSCETDAWVYINPQMRDFLEDHIHYQIELEGYPAGTHTPPVTGHNHVITSADDSIRGWLPANHSVFNSTAPDGAKFGYNLSAHPELNQLWPPIPVTAAIIEIRQRDLDTTPAKVEGLQRVPETYYKIDVNGIWWMTDCYNQVPWDTMIDTSDEVSSSISLNECPLDPPTQVILSFLKMTFATDKSVVTSLRPAADQPISFVNCSGIPATTGDLYALLTVESTIGATPIRGGQALKTVSQPSLHFQKGWMAEGLYAGSAEIVLNGSHQELLDPLSAAGPSNPVLHQGIIRIDVQPDAGNREIHPQITKLGDAVEREYKGVTYIGFPSGRNSSIRMRYNVPPSGLPDTPKMKIRALMFGRAIGPWSAMTLKYYRITQPVAGTPFTLTEGDTALTFDVVTPTDNYNGVGGNLPADNVIQVESSEFTIAAGDTVFIELARGSAASPTFTNEIGVIRVGGIIVPGSA